LRLTGQNLSYELDHLGKDGLPHPAFSSIGIAMGR